MILSPASLSYSRPTLFHWGLLFLLFFEIPVTEILNEKRRSDRVRASRPEMTLERLAVKRQPD